MGAGREINKVLSQTEPSLPADSAKQYLRKIPHARVLSKKKKITFPTIVLNIRKETYSRLLLSLIFS